MVSTLTHAAIAHGSSSEYFRSSVRPSAGRVRWVPLDPHASHASAHHGTFIRIPSQGSTATETNGTMGITPPECNSCSPSHHIDEAL